MFNGFWDYFSSAEKASIKRYHYEISIATGVSCGCTKRNEEENEMYWYETIETCAVKMGMEYYESLTDEEIAEIDKFWEDIA